MPFLRQRRGASENNGFGNLMLIAILTLLSGLATAQVGTILDTSKLPQCALSCTNLVNAQLVCVPPSAPQSNQATYQSCFCNSNYLVNYKAGAVSPTCDEACTGEADRNKILSWYQSVCNGGAVVTPGNGNGAVVGPTATTTGTAKPTGTSAGTGQSGTKSSGSGQPSWIQIHYRWIIMVTVLFVAGILAIILGLWLKRRHDRKWALGGFTRESMLNYTDATNALQNRHPDAPQSVSQVHVPANDGPAFMSGAVGPRTSHLAPSRGKEKAHRVMGDEEAGVARSHSHRLEKRGSKSTR